MTSYTPNPPCFENKLNCFANTAAHCNVLNNTKFKGACPFYKDLVEYHKELERLGLKPPPRAH